jgi:single-strand DNA-binding protein
MSLNKVFLQGNLGKDPVLKQVKDTYVCEFPLATSEQVKGQDGTYSSKATWHNIVVWGKQAENSAKFLTKGSSALIEGRIQVRSWEKDGVTQYKTEIVADRVLFLNRPKDGRAEADGGQPGVPMDTPTSEDEFGFSEPKKHIKNYAPQTQEEASQWG